MGVIPEFSNAVAPKLADIDSRGITGVEPGLDLQMQDRIRRLAQAAEVIHSLTYYSAEINTMPSEGFRGWWHTYFAYRPAPMGAVEAGVVTAAFYNFAPRFVARAVPGVWSIMTPEQAHSRRQELIGQALERISVDGSLDEPLDTASELIKASVADLTPEGRPLYAAYADIPWPDTVGLAVWHGCTLLREYRGDGHNLVLAASGIDGCECHVFMAANGHGNQPTITGIRGWTAEEWHAAVTRLQGRGYMTNDGSYTEAGLAVRKAVERHTDALAMKAISSLGAERADTLLSALESIADYLTAHDEVAGTWPPPATIKPV